VGHRCAATRHKKKQYVVGKRSKKCKLAHESGCVVLASDLDKENVTIFNSTENGIFVLFFNLQDPPKIVLTLLN
jgi:hypothetical protein